MKNIYELLNDIEIDEEIEEAEVTEMEKNRIKNKLKKKIRNNIDKKWKKSSVAAAICCSLIGGTLAVGIINPAYAANIPVVGDIFRFLDNRKTGAYDKYKENATEINVAKESAGATITLKDAIFDGRTISYTYELQSDKDLGARPFFMSNGALELTVKNYNGGMGGSGQIRKIDGNTYVGLSSYTLDKEMDEINCTVQFANIMAESNDGYEELGGKWDFAIHLEAVKGLTKQVNQTAKSGEIEVTVDSITQTPMSCLITYSEHIPSHLAGNEMNRPSIELVVKDDIGSLYEVIANSGNGNELENRTNYATIGKINENATKLILTPSIILPSGGGGVAMGEDGKEVVLEWEDNINREMLEGMEFDDIIVMLTK